MTSTAPGSVDAGALCERARAASAVFITVTEERARREAAASAERLRAGAPRGPLDGVPVAWKDLFDVAGTPTTAASALRRDAALAATDAPVVARLAAAGMVCVGKTNLSELAYSGLGLNPHFGTPRNPHGSGRAPGGSSSGSAVAVAAGVVPCAIGTDTAGSIRVPAAFCGIVGFRPSSARSDGTGLLPLAPSLDTIGPLATSVADVVALDAALRGVEPPAPAAAALRGVEPSAPAAAAPLRLVVPAGDLVDDVDPGVAACFAAALDALADAGAEIVRRPLAALERARALLAEHGSIVGHEAWRVHAALLDSPDAQRIDRRVLRRLREGRALPPAGYDALVRARPRARAALAAELGTALAVLPTAPHVAPEIAALERDDDVFMAVNTRTLRATLATSYLDMPGVSLPMGTAEHGLPAGLLLTGASGEDDRVLAAALGAEAAVRC
ncbi:MAG TPA: amidase family protein [Solirubrobacteraceae bacterium]|nr:amidase family protein [Solirubrobacteraceae bacterium]